MISQSANLSTKPEKITTEKTRAVLRARRQALARPLHEDAAQDEMEIVVFSLGEDRYAFETAQVREVFPVAGANQIAALPGAPLWVRGILNVRGHILAVLDLPRLFGMSDNLVENADSTEKSAPVIILRGQRAQTPDAGESNLPTGDVALATHGVEGVRGLLSSQIEAGHALEGTPGARYLRGLSAEGITLLDAALLFNDAQLIVQAK